MFPPPSGLSSCVRKSFDSKTLLRVSHNLLHGGGGGRAHKFPRTKHSSSTQQHLKVFVQPAAH